MPNSIALTLAQIETIILEHGEAIGVAIDTMERHAATDKEVGYAAWKFVNEHPEIKISVVDASDGGEPSAAKLPEWLLEMRFAIVVVATWAKHPRNRLRSLILETIRPHSIYLSGARQ
jgi:hypothetical protein